MCKMLMCIDIINGVAYLFDRWWSEVQCNSDGSRQYIIYISGEIQNVIIALNVIQMKAAV